MIQFRFVNDYRNYYSLRSLCYNHAGGVGGGDVHSNAERISSVEKGTFGGTEFSWKHGSPLFQPIEETKLEVGGKKTPGRPWKCLSLRRKSLVRNEVYSVLWSRDILFVFVLIAGKKSNLCLA
jgi:hypothetical protein